ncbi:MAG: aspartate-semialdehyde dehydrogenase [Bauldia sp.]|nr:aspartate-semialdehyde dehydrogenase [Bauldia sp.]
MPIPSHSLLRFEGYGLTTAEILYRMPDHRDLLQTFLWQDYDLSPGFPALSRFLAYWRTALDGPLHSVRVAHRALVGADDFRVARIEFALN